MIEFLKKAPEDKELQAISAPIHGSWINVIAPTDTEIEELSKNYGVPKEFITPPLDENETPRIERENEIIMIIFRLPIKLNNSDDSAKIKFDTMPIGIILTNDYFITICKQKNAIIDDFRCKLKNFNTTLRTRFLLLILHRINHYYNDFLSIIEKEVDDIESGLERYIKNKEIINFFSLKKTLIYFNTSVVANNNVLKKILGGKIATLYEEDEDLLEDIIIENDQALEMVSVYRNIISSTLDAYASIVSNNLNSVIKVLTIITIFLSIPTMITSFYGMNINLPFQHHPLAFIYVIGIFTGLTFLLFSIFKASKWL